MNDKKLKRIERKYPLVLRLSSSSRVEVILWFVSWQINNPNEKVVIKKPPL